MLAVLLLLPILPIPVAAVLACAALLSPRTCFPALQDGTLLLARQVHCIPTIHLHKVGQDMHAFSVSSALLSVCSFAAAAMLELKLGFAVPAAMAQYRCHH